MKKIIPIILRYLAIVLLSLNSLYLFYLIFTPLTVYLVHFILSIFYSASLEKSTIIINGIMINLIDACIAGSAYFLLFLLNFSTPKIKKRFFVLFACFSAFLIINIIRIVVLSTLFLSDFSYFMQAHLLSWYVLTALFVILIWIYAIRIFRIKEIPVYSDFNYIKKLIKK